jgi:hypothetical protein
MPGTVTGSICLSRPAAKELDAKKCGEIASKALRKDELVLPFLFILIQRTRFPDLWEF